MYFKENVFPFCYSTPLLNGLVEYLEFIHYCWVSHNLYIFLLTTLITFNVLIVLIRLGIVLIMLIILITLKILIMLIMLIMLIILIMLIMLIMVKLIYVHINATLFLFKESFLFSVVFSGTLPHFSALKIRN